MVRIASHFRHESKVKHKCLQFNYFYVCYRLIIVLQARLTDYALQKKSND